MTAQNSLVLALFMSSVLWAGTVRTVGVNNGAMTPIYLKMGKSTVLRFVEKPKKVVIGNQNFYGLEFIENDVAIQPMGSVATNLFVYTQTHTYGFLLIPGERYDDLVFIRWRYPEIRQDSRPQVQKVQLPNLSFKLGDDMKVTLAKIQGPSALDLHLIDFTIENVSKRELMTRDLVLIASRSGQVIAGQKVVVEKESLKPSENTTARIVLKLETTEPIQIDGRFGSVNGKVVIGRKYL
jgi:hypothetical protein